MKHNYR